MKNTQAKLSPADLLASEVTDLRRQIARKDVEISELQARIYAQQIALTYGNPDEVLNFAPDGTIIRSAKDSPQPAAPPRKKKRRKKRR
jgi:hypothetical protein